MTDLRVLELMTSAKFNGHVIMRSGSFHDSLNGQAFGSVLKQAMLDYWAAVEGRETAKSETMLFLFATIKDWWNAYLDAQKRFLNAPPAAAASLPRSGSGAAAVDWSATDFGAPGDGSLTPSPVFVPPADDLEWLSPISYLEYKAFAAAYRPSGSGGLNVPRLLYRQAACVALNDMENDAYYNWNNTEFAARIAKVLLNNTPERILAALVTGNEHHATDTLTGWPRSLLRDVTLDPSSGLTKPLMTGGFAFQGGPRQASSAVDDTALLIGLNPAQAKIAQGKMRGIRIQQAAEQHARIEQSEATLKALARTSAMQIDCYCSAVSGTDQAGRAKSLYDLEIWIQADTNNLLQFADTWGTLPNGPIGNYARVYGIAAWPVDAAGFSLDSSLPAGKDQDATTGLSRSLSGSEAYEESNTLSVGADANRGFQGKDAMGGGGVSAGYSQTRSHTQSTGWEKNLSVTIPHVDFLNHRIESNAGVIAPLIVFRMAPPFEPDINTARVVRLCRDLVQRRIDESYTQMDLVNGTHGVENFLDDAFNLGRVTLQQPTDASVGGFQQSCVFSFSRDDERYGPLFKGMEVRYRIQFIVGIGQVHAGNDIVEHKKPMTLGETLTKEMTPQEFGKAAEQVANAAVDGILGKKDDSKEKEALGRLGQENLFMRDFIFDLVIEVPK